MNKAIAKVWIFRSSSGGGKTYETLLMTDGKTSCNCPEWTRRAVRSCKHTRMVDMNVADTMATSFKAYAENAQSAPKEVQMTTLAARAMQPIQLRQLRKLRVQET